MAQANLLSTTYQRPRVQAYCLPRVKIPLISESFTPALHRYILDFEKPDRDHTWPVQGCRVPTGNDVIPYYCHRCAWSGHKREDHCSGQLTISHLVESAAIDQIRRYAPNATPMDNTAFAKKFFQLGLHVIQMDIDLLPRSNAADEIRYCSRSKLDFEVLNQELIGKKLKHKSADKVIAYYNQYAQDLVNSNRTMFELVKLEDIDDMQDLFQLPSYLPESNPHQLRQYADDHLFDTDIYKDELGEPNHSVRDRERDTFVLPSLASCIIDEESEVWNDNVFLRIYLAAARNSVSCPTGVSLDFVKECVNVVKGKPVKCDVSPAMISTIVRSGVPALKPEYTQRLSQHASRWPQMNLDSSEYIKLRRVTIRFEKRTRENKKRKEGRDADEPIWIPTCKCCKRCGMKGHNGKSCESKSVADLGCALADFTEERLINRQGSPLLLAFDALDVYLLCVETRIYELEVEINDSEIKRLKGKKTSQRVRYLRSENAWRWEELKISYTRPGTCNYKTTNCSTYLAARYMGIRHKLMEIDHPQIAFTTSPLDMAYPSMGRFRTNLFDKQCMVSKRLLIRNSFYKQDEEDFLAGDDIDLQTPHPTKRVRRE